MGDKENVQGRPETDRKITQGGAGRDRTEPGSLGHKKRKEEGSVQCNDFNTLGPSKHRKQRKNIFGGETEGTVLKRVVASRGVDQETERMRWQKVTGEKKKSGDLSEKNGEGELVRKYVLLDKGRKKQGRREGKANLNEGRNYKRRKKTK